MGAETRDLTEQPEGRAAKRLVDAYNEATDNPISRDVLRGMIASHWPDLHEAIHQLGDAMGMMVVKPSTDPDDE